MTRSDLLCELLHEDHVSQDKLTRRFGRRWYEPMRGLMELGLVMAVFAGEGSRATFHVVPWMGKAAILRAQRIAA
jgi:hypothetical protein